MTRTTDYKLTKKASYWAITKGCATEHDEQVAFFDYVNMMTKQERTHWRLGYVIHAIPNGGHRHPAVAMKLKREGVKPGVPDIEDPVASRGFYAMHIEMKRRKDYSISDEQREFMANLRACGRLTVIARGWEEAAAWWRWYHHVDAWPDDTDVREPNGHRVPEDRQLDPEQYLKLDPFKTKQRVMNIQPIPGGSP